MWRSCFSNHVSGSCRHTAWLCVRPLRSPVALQPPCTTSLRCPLAARRRTSSQLTGRFPTRFKVAFGGGDVPGLLATARMDMGAGRGRMLVRSMPTLEAVYFSIVFLVPRVCFLRSVSCRWTQLWCRMAQLSCRWTQHSCRCNPPSCRWTQLSCRWTQLSCRWTQLSCRWDTALVSEDTALESEDTALVSEDTALVSVDTALVSD